MNQLKLRPFQYIERLFVGIIQWGSVLALAAPLIVTPGTLFFYIFGKTIFFRIVVEVMAVFWIFLCIYKPHYRPPFKHPIVIALTGFIGIVVITMFTGVDAYQSFWSTQERMTGVFTLLHCWLWFLMMVSVLKEWKQWRKLLIATLLVNVLVALYGIGQRLHVSLLLPDTDVKRLASTLGNPIYLGVYALMHVYLALFLFVRERDNLWKLFCVGSILLNVFVLFQSASRGVTLALAVTLIPLLISIGYLAKNEVVRRTIRSSLITLVIIGIVSGVFLATPFGRQWASDSLPAFANRVVYHLFDDPGRLALWTVGVKGFIARPFLGWGWENFAYINDTYIHIARGALGSPWNDHSHNQLIDIFALTGIFGGIAYLAVWMLYGKLFVQKIRTQPGLAQQVPLLIMLTLFAAYFLQNLTIFDTPGPLIIFYFMFALGFYLVNEKPEFEILSGESAFERKRARDERALEEKKPFPRTGYVALPLLLLMGGGVAVYANIIPFRSSQQGVSALAVAARGNISGAIPLLQPTLDNELFTHFELREQLADIVDSLVNDQRIPEAERQKILTLAIAQAEDSVKEKPRYLRHMLRLIYLYRLNAENEVSANDRATELAKAALVLYPNRYEIYKELAESSFFRKDPKQGIEYAKKALTVDVVEARSLWYLAIAYARANDIDKSLDTAWKAMAKDSTIIPYVQYISFLATVMPPTTDHRVLEYFATLAAAYGPKDNRLFYARNRVFAQAEQIENGKK
ncbi:MAG: O-antigen ligase family protein [bacterium]|nr:O-antigen ligase family protein [bacterium]